MKKTLVCSTLVASLAFGSGVMPQAESEVDEILTEEKVSVDYEVVKASEAKSTFITPAEQKEVESILGEANLHTMNNSAIPDDAYVMNFDSSEELEKFLFSQNSTSSVVFEAKQQEVQNNLFGLFHAQTVDAATRKKFHYSQDHGGVATLHLYAYVTKLYNGKLADNVVVSTSLTGFVPYLKWEERTTDYRLSATKLSGIAFASGESSGYLFFKGVGTLWTRNINMELKFFASKM